MSYLLHFKIWLKCGINVFFFFFVINIRQLQLNFLSLSHDKDETKGMLMDLLIKGQFLEDKQLWGYVSDT